MKNLTAVTVAATLLVIAACHDTTTAPIVSGGVTSIPQTPRGAVVASTYCAGCHGTLLEGATSTLTGVASPGLTVVRQYTSAQFDVLLVAGLTDEGPYVRTDMTSTRIIGIPAAERHALYDYLVNVWKP